MLTIGPNLELLDGGEYGEGNYHELTRLFRGLDLLVQPHVISDSVDTPPTDPAEGDAYIVPAGATGAWAGHVNEIARWTARSSAGPVGTFAAGTPRWEYFIPKINWLFGVDDAEKHVKFDGDAWVTFQSGSGGGGDYELPIASGSVLGGIKVGANLTIEPDGTLNAASTGEQGPPGPPGADGQDGVDGEPGAPGSVWRNGSGAPSNGLGINGDYYLDVTNGNVYEKAAGTYTLQTNIKGATGAQGPQGETGAGLSIKGELADPSELPGVGDPGDGYLISGDLWVWTGSGWENVGNIQGPAGAPGSVWRSGAGTPSDALGIDNDFYLNTSNGDVFKKAAGTYGTAITNIKGPQGNAGATGTAGATWYTGTGAPAGGTGVNNDLYLDLATGDVYKKTAGSWGSTGNIKGPTGATGGTGPAGADGAAGSVWRDGTGTPSNGLGVNGDYYLDTSNGNVYKKVAGVYTGAGNILGPQGPAGATGDTGPAGSAGTPGSVWRDGSGAPSNGTGVDGDYYLNTTNGDVYKRTAGTYSVVGNIKGPQGATGETGPAGSSAWDDITDKPSTFPPSAHSHAISDVTGLQAALDGKQAFDADTAKTDVEQTWTAQQTPMKGTLTDGATVNWSGDTNGQVVKLTTAAARTMAAPTDINEGALYVLRLTTGGFTPAWNAAYKWPSGGAPSSLVSGTYVFTFMGGPSNTLEPTGPGYLTGV